MPRTNDTTRQTPASTPRKTAAEAYATRRSEIARLLDVLDMELARHDERAKADPRNRGFEGNLGKVRGDLMDTVAFLSGMERSDIERFLDDAE
jgi:hypothetical protein